MVDPMIRYSIVWTSGSYSVEVFNGVESGGLLSVRWHDINDLRRDMELLDIHPVYPPDVQR